MKYAILPLLMLAFHPNLLNAQEDPFPEDDVIFWTEDYKLVWTDFEGLGDRYSDNAAFSVIGFENSLNYTDQEYRSVIKVFFDKNASWSKTWTALLLMHEQGHFDLAEIAARKFRRKVKEIMEADQMTEDLFKTLSYETIEALEDTQNEYDELTNYSMDYKAQLRWAAHINDLLEQLNEYASPEIIVKR